MSTAGWHPDYLDSFRGVVVLIHSHTLLGKQVLLPQTVRYVVDCGARGVGLFFIVSAFIGQLTVGLETS
jgi:hypothetical protein